MKIKRLMMQALIVGLFSVSANAQKNVSIDWYGFVAAQSFNDIHKSVSAAEGFLYLYPTDKTPDAEGDDMGQIASGSEFGTMARVGFTLKGPELLGVSTRAKAEIEFSGHSQSENHVLYRHAFMAFDWDDGSSLILGQTWHPMNDLFPSTIGIAIGSPFNPLNRSPQLRGESFLGKGKNIKLTTALIFQAMNTSVGPDPANELNTIKSNSFNRNSMMPMIYAGLDFNIGDLKLGAGLEYQRITPYVDAADKNTKYYLEGFTGMIQAQYNKEKLTIKGKALLGQNMSHLGICSGYGKVAGTDRKYVPLTAVSSWAQILYGGNLKFGLFGGYMKNLGANDDLAIIYANGGGNIDSMWRCTPSVQYNVGNVSFGCEFECTSVAYGEVEAKGTVTNTHDVFNLRSLLSVMYNF